MSVTVELCQKTDLRCQSLGKGESKERNDRRGQNYYQYIISYLIYYQSNIIDSWEEENERKGVTGTRAELAQDDERRKGKPS